MDYSKLYAPIPKEIISLLDSIIKGVEAIMAEKDFKQLMPTIHAIKGNAISIYGIAIDFDESTKPIIGGMIRKIAAENDAAAFVTEAWTTEHNSKRSPALCAAMDSGQDAVVMAPRLHPERQESVLIKLHIKERLVMVHCPITRVDRRPVLGEWAIRIDSADPGVKVTPMSFG